MIYKQRLVFDTSAFTNALPFKKSQDSVKFALDLVNLLAEARMKLKISCYIPYPTVYQELILSLKSRKCKESTIIKVDTWLVKKTPDRFEVKIPAEILYDYISAMRERMNKGLRIAEEAVEAANKGGKATNGDVVKTLRNKYKIALRQGILDSKEDLDVLLLAKELDAAVVTADEGIAKWAERMGLRFVEARVFPGMIAEYLKRYEMDKE